MTPEMCSNLGDAYIWYDFFAIPQPTSKKANVTVNDDLALAVGTIPAYVDAATHFIVLCPPTPHSDTAELCNMLSWSLRGWCRTELAARTFSLKDETPLLFCTSESSVAECFPFAWVHCQPRFGDFSVEEDRKKVNELIVTIMTRRIEWLTSKDDMFEARFLRAMIA